MRIPFVPRCRGVAVALVSALLCVASVAVRADAALPAAKKTVLTHFLDALRAANFNAAFASLSSSERAYFRTPANYASIFTADRWKLDSYRILASTTRADTTVALVSERVDFYDFQRDVAGSVTVRVPYGVVSDGGRLGIKDPYHPWHAIVPQKWTATANGVTAGVRKISFYTGRVELFMTFENRGNAVVTLLPYGRSVVHDDTGKPHAPIETKLPGLTDANLYTGVRLPPSGRYTGFMTFFTANRFTPASLSVTLRPLLADGADAPFELDLPPYALR